VEPDGENINLNCGSLHPEVVAEEVKKHGAHLGIALDGDADRVVFVDEKGNVVDGDDIMAICAIEMLKENRLKSNTLVATVMSNLALDKLLASKGGRVVRTQVGDRYVVEKMRAEGYNFGGEQSGHLIYLDYTTTGDGMIGALQILAAMIRSGKPLSELASILEKYPQVQCNVKVRERVPFEQLPEVCSAIRDAEQKLGSDGRVLVRYSGTELKARILLEGPDKACLDMLAQQITQAIQSCLGV
jgi:phosphoglucosamine mutase